ncbi:putative immunity protein [Streptomyces anthocyanicus]|uniref:putative immunity protein n=1 Tax=Streptomyces anthocyanicus TaxID=68174 RepID=UPI00365172E3
MTGEASGIVLSKQDLREVTAFAAACAEAVLEVFEGDQPDDLRPRDAIDAAWEFARGGERGKALRDRAWAALTAAKSADTAAAREAARAAMAAAGAAYLHPLAKATQVKHILGAGAYAARAPKSSPTTIGVLVPDTLSRRCIVRRRSSSTYSNASRRRRVAADGLVS